MTRSGAWLVLVTALAVVGSGVGVVYAKYLSRREFVQLQSLRAERDQVDIQWARLQLEESTLATYSRVEADARDRLDLRIPHPSDVVVIKAP